MGLDIGLTMRSVLYGLVFATPRVSPPGVVPALQASLVSPEGTLRAQASAVTGARRAQRVREALIVVQVAVAAMLLVGGGTAHAKRARASAIDPGFDRHNVLTMRITLPPQKYNPAGIASFFEALVDRVRSLPGIERAAVATQFPPDVNFSTRIRIDGVTVERHRRAARRPSSRSRAQDYFATLGMPLAAGRLFDARDTSGAPQVAVVNETFARRYLADGSPIGRRMAMAGDDTDSKTIRWAEIVGVVRDTRSQGAATPASPELYLDVRQLEQWWNQLFLLVRTAGDPRAILPDVRRAVAAIDPDQPVYARARRSTTLSSRRTSSAV